MTSIESDIERLNLLLEDLRLRALWPGQQPYVGMAELGKFVEEVHKAVAQELEFVSQSVQVSEWHVRMGNEGYTCHPSLFGPLQLIYGYRNISSHPHEEMHDISYQEVKRRFDDLSDLVPRLVRLLTRHDLVSRLFAVQVCSYPQRRAEMLRAAITASEAAVTSVIEYALPFITDKRRGFLNAPPEKHLELVVPILASVAASVEHDLLRGLAEHLLNRSPPVPNPQPIHVWLRQYGRSEPAAAVRTPLHVIRFAIDHDPVDGTGFLVREVAVVEPAMPGLANALPGLPLSVQNPSRFPEVVTKVLNRIGVAIRHLHGSRSNLPQWAEFVLDLELPHDLACVDFELAEHRPGRALTNMFRCVTIRPLFDTETLTPLRGIDAPLAHPRLSRNAIAVWQVNESVALFKAGQGKLCLFTGPAAWRCDATPPVVEAFDGFPGAVVCAADDESGLEPIFETEEERQWPEILDRVTRLRKSGVRVKVLWNDPAYAPFLAETL